MLNLAQVLRQVRSGFASVVTGIFFLLAMFFSPLLSIVTKNVTAPALIIVGALMVAPALRRLHGIVLKLLYQRS
ncbi:hypothetical protein ACEQPO_04405 [Bacillus sp. SL00103]